MQQAVHLDREPYPYYEEGGLGFRDLTADLDPFVFGTDTQGILTRLSAASLAQRNRRHRVRRADHRGQR